jgi:NO-binding membrane sensor protein with MHYT domain
MTESSTAEFSMLLWLLGAVVAGLAAHLSQGWVRMAQRGPRLLRQWTALLLASGTMGAGLCAGLVLCMQAEALSFPVGYRVWAALALWAGALLACLPSVLLQAYSARGWVLLGSGTLLAAVAMGLEFGWVWAAGFRPGVLWRNDLVGAAAVLQLIGLAVAAWLAFSQASQDSDRRVLWRLGSAALVALTVMAGQTVMLLAAGVLGQRGSVYQSELPGTVLSLVFGVLVPLVLAAMALDLWLRRTQRKQRGQDHFNPKKRHKRRHRVRQL